MSVPRDAQGIPILPREIDWRRNYAEGFARMKGRLPENRLEFAEWLLEFGKDLEARLQLAIEVFEDHMRTCNRPVILSKDWLSK